MPTSSATCQTANASRYLQQLCKHFAHKVEVTYDERHGVMSFSCGTANLTAAADALDIEVNAPDAESLDQTKHVIESHLLRFAFREELPPLRWAI